jgi:Fe2+ or Zn2+ uptake regulation protein
MSYKTAQKMAILRHVKESRNHPTAQEVFDCVKKDMPNISFATVYRNLGALAEAGEIKEVQFIDKKKRYEGILELHQHFICEKCERIIDMQLSELLNIDQASEQMQCHQVNSFNLELLGICAKCK